jgi:hypothetical protein
MDAASEHRGRANPGFCVCSQMLEADAPLVSCTRASSSSRAGEATVPRETLGPCTGSRTRSGTSSSSDGPASGSRGPSLGSGSVPAVASPSRRSSSSGPGTLGPSPQISISGPGARRRSGMATTGSRGHRGVAPVAIPGGGLDVASVVGTLITRTGTTGTTATGPCGALITCSSATAHRRGGCIPIPGSAGLKATGEANCKHRQPQPQGHLGSRKTLCLGLHRFTSLHRSPPRSGAAKSGYWSFSHTNTCRFLVSTTPGICIGCHFKKMPAASPHHSYLCHDDPLHWRRVANKPIPTRRKEAP